jgi:hypothetical protein
MIRNYWKTVSLLLALGLLAGSISACSGSGITPAPDLPPGHQYPLYGTEGGG